MQAIAISGPRRLNPPQSRRLKEFFKQIQADRVLIGDAPGTDAAARLWWPNHELYAVKGNQAWCYAERTLRMVDALAAEAGILYAFPNKECSPACTPAKQPSGSGSGTWLAIAAACYRNVTVKVLPLEPNLKLPAWLEPDLPGEEWQQLSLF